MLERTDTGLDMVGVGDGLVTRVKFDGRSWSQPILVTRRLVV